MLSNQGSTTLRTPGRRKLKEGQRLGDACPLRIRKIVLFRLHILTTANMVLKLRLARPATPGGSRKHHPRYNIVLAHARYAIRDLLR